jgi:uncharacterized protein (DUF362 family)
MADSNNGDFRLITSDVLIQEYREKELSRRLLIQGALASSALLMGGIACGGESSGRTGWLGGTGGTGGNGSAPDMGGSGNPADSGRPEDMGAADQGAVDAAQDPDAGEPDAGAPDMNPDGAIMAAGHLVGMGYHESDYMAALNAAFLESMSLSFIEQGQTVYFKVNCNNGDPYPHSTKPELIVELARRCRDHGASRIIVGDRSFWGDQGTAVNMRNNGVAGAAETANAELMVFDDNTVDWVQIPAADVPDWNGGFRLPRPVVEADHIINLPCMKTHFISEFTMSMKNMIGLVHPGDRRRAGNLDVHVIPRLWKQIAQINKHITPSLNILDGYEALIQGGPTVRDGRGPAYASPKVIIVSADRVATDVTGIAVLQTLSPAVEEITQSSAWRSGQIRQATRDGIGLRNPMQLDLSGPTVPPAQFAEYLANAQRV